VNTLLTLFDKF